MPALTSLYNPVRNRIKVGILGDSIAAQKSSCIFQICVGLGWEVSKTMYAVGGSKIEEQESKIAAMVSDGVNVAMVQVGTNNISESMVDIYQKYEELLLALKSSLISPIMFFIPQKEQNKVGNVWKINQILDFLCSKYNVPVFDAWSNFSNISGGWNSGESSDNVHPNQTTRLAAASRVIGRINALFADRLLAFTNYDGLLSNPCFANDSNSDGLSDNWTAVDTTYTTFSRIDKGNGRFAQRITATNNPTSVHSTLRQNLAAIAGHKYRLQFKATMNCSSNVASFNAYANIYMSFGVNTYNWGYTPLTGEFYCDFTATCPQGESSMYVWLQIYSAGGFTGTVTMDVEQVLLTDLTALGIA